MNLIYALLAGLLFGLGLILGGMTDPAKVKGFLDLAGAWNPSLALVMAGAIGVGLGAFAWAKRRQQQHKRAWSGARMEWPAATRVDAPLLLGGVLFGIGWGIAGFCPGPVLVAAASGFGPALWFLPAMLVGMLLHDEGWLRFKPGSAALNPPSPRTP
jgi:uncharacterized protein